MWKKFFYTSNIEKLSNNYFIKLPFSLKFRSAASVKQKKNSYSGWYFSFTFFGLYVFLLFLLWSQMVEEGMVHRKLIQVQQKSSIVKFWINFIDKNLSKNKKHFVLWTENIFLTFCSHFIVSCFLKCNKDVFSKAKILENFLFGNHVTFTSFWKFGILADLERVFMLLINCCWWNREF